MPVLPSSLLEPLWDQFVALLPEHVDSHPLGCLNPRIADRVVFEHVIAALVHGSGYERVATPGCSDRTIRRQVTYWSGLGITGQLHALGARYAAAVITIACWLPALVSLALCLHHNHAGRGFEPGVGAGVRSLVSSPPSCHRPDCRVGWRAWRSNSGELAASWSAFTSTRRGATRPGRPRGVVDRENLRRRPAGGRGEFARAPVDGPVPDGADAGPRLVASLGVSNLPRRTGK